MTPTRTKPIRREAGPPIAKAFPHPMKRPAPMDPPIAMNWRCRLLSVRLRGEVSPSTGYDPSFKGGGGGGRRRNDCMNLTIRFSFVLAVGVSRGSTPWLEDSSTSCMVDFMSEVEEFALFGREVKR